jgi:hypothetical protein
VAIRASKKSLSRWRRKTIKPQTARRGEDHADNTDEEMIQKELSGEIIGGRMNVLCHVEPFGFAQGRLLSRDISKFVLHAA